MTSGNGEGEADSVQAENLGRTAIGLLAKNNEEVSRICARLCALMPPGCSYLFALDVSETKIVMQDGAPIGESVELIQITRPASYIQQRYKVVRK